MTEDLREALTHLADEPYIPHRVDVAAARRAGRRTLWTRRLAPPLAVAAVAAVATTAVVALPHRGSEGVDTAATAHRPSPLIARASFGWLPDGYVISGKEQPLGPDGVYELAALNGGSLRGSQYYLSVYPKGPEPDLGLLPGAIPAKAVSAPDVGGRPAHWLQPPSFHAGDARLRFQIAAGQWAELEVDQAPDGTNVTQQLYRVANAVRPEATPVAFPIKVADIPVRLKAWDNVVDTDPAAGIGWRANLSFTVRAPGDTENTDSDLTITVTRASDRHTATMGLADIPSSGTAPNTTINGQRLYYKKYPGTPPSTSLHDLIEQRNKQIQSERRAAATATPKSGSGTVVPLKAGEPSLTQQQLEQLQQLAVERNAGTEALIAYNVHGLDIVMTTSAAGSKALAAVGGLPGLFKKTTLYGLNPADWTTDPLG